MRSVLGSALTWLVLIDRGSLVVRLTNQEIVAPHARES